MDDGRRRRALRPRARRALDAQGLPLVHGPSRGGKAGPGEPAGDRFARRRTRGAGRAAAVATLRRRPRLSAGFSLLHHPGSDLMPKDVILTPEGLQKLKDELEELSGTRRRDVAQRIKEAREF